VTPFATQGKQGERDYRVAGEVSRCWELLTIGRRPPIKTKLKWKDASLWHAEWCA